MKAFVKPQSVTRATQAQTCVTDTLSSWQEALIQCATRSGKHPVFRNIFSMQTRRRANQRLIKLKSFNVSPSLLINMIWPSRQEVLNNLTSGLQCLQYFIFLGMCVSLWNPSACSLSMLSLAAVSELIELRRLILHVSWNVGKSTKTFFFYFSVVDNTAVWIFFLLSFYFSSLSQTE